MTPLLRVLIASGAIALGLVSASCATNNSERLAHEIAAIQSIRTIHTAEVQYYSQNGRYAASFAELADLIGPELATGQRNGYQFTLSPNGTGYQITAVPVTFNVTGSRTFFSDQTLVVRQNRGAGPATANSPELGQ